MLQCFVRDQNQDCEDGADRPKVCNSGDNSATECICSVQESFAPLTIDPSLDEYKAYKTKRFSKDDRFNWLVTATNGVGEGKAAAPVETAASRCSPGITNDFTSNVPWYDDYSGGSEDYYPKIPTKDAESLTVAWNPPRTHGGGSNNCIHYTDEGCKCNTVVCKWT